MVKINSTLTEKIAILQSKGTRVLRDIFVNDIPPALKLNKKGFTATQRELAEFSQKYTFEGLLPYEAYDEQSDLYYNKETVGFMLIASGATGLSETDLTTLNSIFTESHPVNTCIQVTVLNDATIEPILDHWRVARESSVETANSAIFNLMAKKRVEYLSSGKWESLYPDKPFLVGNYHLIISYSVPIQKGEDYCDIDTDMLEQIKRARLGIKSNLRSANIHSMFLKPELFINIMNEFLNPSIDPQPKLRWDKMSPLAVQMVSSDTTLLFDTGAGSIIHKNKPYSIIPFDIRQFPDEWAGTLNRDLIGSFTENIRRFPCRFIATLNVLIPDQVSAKGAAQRNVLRATQMADSPVSKFVPAWSNRKDDWQYIQKRVDAGDKLLKSFYQIMLVTPQGRESECEQKVKAIYESIGWIPSRSRYTLRHSLLSVLPMGLGADDHHALKVLKRYRTMSAWNCTQIAPWITEWKGTGTPMLLFMGRRGQITFFNPFDNTAGNFNIACCATSGAGKSFLIQEWVSSTLATGGRAFVIDAGGSYRNICHLLGGTYIDFADKGIVLNPFTKMLSRSEIIALANLNGTDPELAVKDYYDDFMPMLKSLLSQMASPKAALEETQSACIEKAIYAALESYGNKATISTVAEKLQEMTLSSGAESKYAADLALMLSSYTKGGMYAKYFEGDSNIDLNNNFVVLELDALNAKGDLQSVVLLILMIQINHAMFLSNNRSQRKVCVIDEAWRLLGAGKAGAFISEGYRVARKHGGSYTTITQKISDYYSSETAEAAFMNSDFVLYLRQKPEELNQAAKEGRINDSGGQLSLIKSLETVQGQYSEVAIQSPSGMSVVRFCVDRFTEKVYSTKAEEVAYLRNAESHGISLQDAVANLVELERSRLGS